MCNLLSNAVRMGGSFLLHETCCHVSLVLCLVVAIMHVHAHQVAACDAYTAGWSVQLATVCRKACEECFASYFDTCVFQHALD